MSWSTNPVAPVKQTGKGWFESGAKAPAPVKGGWFALLEKVAPLRGEGNLTAVVSPRRFERVSFGGEGKMTPVLNPRNYRNAAFSGNGLPTAEMLQTVSVAPQFSSLGKLDLAVPMEDGLHASMGVGYPAQFNASGGLTFIVEGGRPAFDGLYADMIGRYFIPAYFASQGDFVAFIGVLQIALADMIGSGALTADVKQIHPRLAQFAANGQLSVSIVRGAAAIAQLLGTGTLSAQAFARYLSSVGVSGGGALTALLKASYGQSAASGGTGTMAAIVSQRYNVPMQLNIADSPTMENAGEWTGQNGVQSSEQAHSGTYSRKLTAIGDWLPIYLTIFGWKSTAAGRTIRAEAWVRKHAANAGGGVIYIQIWPRDAAGTVVDGNLYVAYDTSTIPNDTWYKLENNVLMPAGTAQFDCAVFLDPYLPVGDIIYVDDLGLYGNSAVPLSGNGTLSATMVRTIEVIPRSAALAGAGVLSATTSKLDPPYIDTFNRADSYDLGPLWTPRVGEFQVYLNGAYGQGVTSLESYVGTMRTNDMEAWVTLANLHGAGTAGDVYVGIGHNETGQGAWGWFNTSSGTSKGAQIGTVATNQWSSPTAWQGSVQTVAAGFAVGDRVGLKRIGNTYYLMHNSTVLQTWVDSGNLIPRDANHRIVAMQVIASTGMRRIEQFEAQEAIPLPLSETFTTPGAYTYNIPAWANNIDEVLLGAGGGGGGCNGILQGEGGGAGQWDYTTLVRGVNFPTNTTQITGTVGTGGTAGGTSSASDGGNGGASTQNAIAGGMGLRSGAGGIGGASSGGAGSGVNGDSPGNITHQGITYTGGATATGNPAVGNAPGGGAASRNAIAGNGAAGARGQVWYRAWT